MTADNLSNFSLFADFAVHNQLSSLPQDEKERVKKAVLNFLAVSIGANAYSESKFIVSTLKSVQNGDIPIFGSETSAGLIAATWANSALGHYLDFDDTYLLTIVHPGTPVIPSVLSVAIKEGKTGSEALYASAIGMEFMLRLSHAIGLNETYSKWHNTSLYGTAGSAVASSVLINANVEQIMSSLLQSLTVVNGFLYSKGSLTKSFQVGRSSAEGVISTMAAMGGITVSKKILDAYLSSFSKTPNLDYISEKLGQTWYFQKDFFKPYPCCVALHPMIDAVLQVRNKVQDISQIEKIEATTSPFTTGADCIMDPKTGLESKFSPTHAIASAIVYGPLYPEHFTDSAVQDNLVSKLRGLTEVRSENTINMGQTILNIRLKNGDKLTSEVNRGPDTPSKDLSIKDIESKFSHLVSPVLGEDKEKEVWNYFASLDRKDDLSEIKLLFQ